MTEAEIRRIVRDEIAKAATNDVRRLTALPMPKYEFQAPSWTPPVSSRSGSN